MFLAYVSIFLIKWYAQYITLLKRKCETCKRRFNRIDVWKINESWLRPRYVCRRCRQPDPSNHSSNRKYERNFWTCAICQQKFNDHAHYLGHPCHFRS